MKPEKSAWQIKIDRVLAELYREEKRLGNRLGFWSSPAYAFIRSTILHKPPIEQEVLPKMQSIQHRRWLIYRRYKATKLIA